jgi:hypothetical protein
MDVFPATSRMPTSGRLRRATMAAEIATQRPGKRAQYPDNASQPATAPAGCGISSNHLKDTNDWTKPAT